AVGFARLAAGRYNRLRRQGRRAWAATGLISAAVAQISFNSSRTTGKDRRLARQLAWCVPPTLPTPGTRFSMPMLTKHKFYGVSLAMLLGGALATIYLMAGASTPRPLPQVDPTAQPDVQPLQRLELIEPGTQVTEQGVEGWSHLVLLVMPELTDGAVDSLHPY